jgi:hypothetical protein
MFLNFSATIAFRIADPVNISIVALISGIPSATEDS